MATMENFKCMLCGYEYQELVEEGEDKERSCPKCRSNSIRHLKARPSQDKTNGKGKKAKQ